MIAIQRSTTATDGSRLSVSTASETDTNDRSIVFYALAADTEDPPPTTTMLHEFISDDGGKQAYSTDPEWAIAGYRRADAPICRVWQNPINVALFVD